MLKNFKIFQKEKNLICGISDKELGNIDFRFGEEKEVLENRRKLAKLLGIDLKNLYEMEQVHGSKIKILRNGEIKKLRDNIVPETDGLVTDLSEIFLMIKTADCFPLLFFDSVKQVVAAVHVGWRGAVEKIFLEVTLAMGKHFGCRISDLKVVIGPGARKCCFIHRHLVQEKLPEWKDYIVPYRHPEPACLSADRQDRQAGARRISSEKLPSSCREEKREGKSLDIHSFVIDKLISVGLKKDNIEDVEVCTICEKQFFSHFRSLRKEESEGRFAAVIGLKNKK